MIPRQYCHDCESWFNPEAECACPSCADCGEPFARTRYNRDWCEGCEPAHKGPDPALVAHRAALDHGALCYFDTPHYHEFRCARAEHRDAAVASMAAALAPWPELQVVANQCDPLGFIVRGVFNAWL